MNQKIYRAAKIIQENSIIHDGYVLVDSGTITMITDSVDLLPKGVPVIDLEDRIMMPGFIDIFLHGGAGKSVMHASNEALHHISKQLLAEATTGWLATVMTASQDRMEEALGVTANYMDTQHKSVAEIYGMHLEGPFLNAKKRGVHPEEYLQEPNISTFESLYQAAQKKIKVLTLASELPNACDLIRYIKSHYMMHIKIGHTTATLKEFEEAVASGVDGITHIFNAMPSMHHRNPGVIGGALSSNVWVQMIVDGLHVHPLCCKMIYDIKKPSRLVIATDASEAKGLGDGEYTIGDLDITVKNKVAYLLNTNKIAGSTISMLDSFYNMIEYTHCNLLEAAQMFAHNPAKIIGNFHQVGSIQVGKDANFAIFSSDVKFCSTILKGDIAFQI